MATGRARPLPKLSCADIQGLTPVPAARDAGTIALGAGDEFLVQVAQGAVATMAARQAHTQECLGDTRRTGRHFPPPRIGSRPRHSSCNAAWLCLSASMPFAVTVT